MVHLPQLIQDLALILAVAAGVSLLFKKLRQPVVLGYLVAGMLVGPHQTFFPQVTDLGGVGIWADIGLIFLLFAIGLEFSFRRLSQLGAAPGITAVFETSFMLFVGFCVGIFLGWPWMDSLFLGAMLAISSTTVLIKTFDELGLKGRRFVSLVIGVLIFEDLVAVLLMVVLTTVAITREFQGLQLLIQGSRLVFFLILWFMIGVFALPNLTRRIRPLLNAESTLVVSLGLCFVMVVLATKAGFSPALGAFVMGSLLAETTEGDKIERVVCSVKDLFSAVFFVSVGMLMNPQILVEQWPLVLLLTAVLIVGKVVAVTMGAFLAGQPLKIAFLAGTSLPQIGEFSYIIAGLGLSLGVIRDTLYPLAVAISVLTTFSTPYMILTADKSFRRLEKILPTKWQRALVRPKRRSEFGAAISIHSFLKGFCTKILLLSTLITAIFLLMSEGVLPWAEKHFAGHAVVLASLTALTVLLCAPLYWGFAFSKVDGQSFSQLWKDPNPRPLIVFLSVSRLVGGIGLLSTLMSQFLFEESAIAVVVGLLIVFTVLLYSPLEKIYLFLEEAFLKNLNQRPLPTEQVQFFEMPPLAPWDAHLVEFVVHTEAECVGQALGQLRIRENFGISIALIKRGDQQITAPGRREMLMPLDHIFAIGTDEQLLKFKAFLDQKKIANGELTSPLDYSLEQLAVTESSRWVGKSIRNSGLRESTRGLVVGIERAGIRLLNPDSSSVIEASDILWIVGDRRLIRGLEQRLPLDEPPFL